MTAPAGYTAVLDEVRGLSWPARRRARNALPGPHAATARGTSAEFVEYRPYRQGDDPRKIDWKLVARTDRVYVRLSPERAIVPTIIVVDASGSMAFPEPGHRKWDWACRIAVGLAATAREAGDPVGLAVALASGDRWVTPRTRRTVLDEMIGVLDLAPSGEAPLAPVLSMAMRRAVRVAVISDFLGDAEAVLALARRSAAAGHELHAVHIVDPLELDPDPKHRLVADPERPDQRRPLPDDAREEYRRRFANWRGQVASGWASADAGYTPVVAGAEPVRRVVRRITMLPGGTRHAL
ncbi:MAG TPA: DUF58 domain-containing protein [Gemmatimonadales bacterium]|nr:DUF58 domain-containing protein [Gemmatimonadales bacterium]